MAGQLKGEVNGKPIGYEIKGGAISGGRPLLVLIHGSGGSRASWNGLFGALGDDFDAIALELPGHGQTPGPVPATIGACAVYVGSILEAWNFDEKPILGGHSLGGAVALECGLTRPEGLAGLVLIGTGSRLAVNPAVFEGLEKDFTGTIGLVGKWSFHKEADPALVDRTTKALAENSAQLLAMDFKACDMFDRREDVGKVTLPTMVACGLQDKMTPPKLSEFLAEGIPGARLELIDKAGHFLSEEQPEKLASALADWVRRI